MKKKSLLDEIKRLADTARCPRATYRDPAQHAAQAAEDFISENLPEFRCGGHGSVEIDAETGNLLVYWKISFPFDDLLHAARLVAKITGGEVSEPEDVCSVSVSMRHDIPMFFCGEGRHAVADDEPMRPEFVDGLRDFVSRFDDINAKAREAVFEPIREAAASRAKYQRAA